MNRLQPHLIKGKGEGLRMRNKILKFFLILCMVTALLPLPHLIAAGDEAGNILRNGNFEDGTFMENDWGMAHGGFYEVKNGDGDVISQRQITNILPENKDGYAAKITNTEKNLNVWFRQRLYKEPPKGVTANKIIPGATYKLSYSIYAELGERNDAGVGCFLIYYSTNNQPNDNSTAIGNKSITYADSSTNGRWTRVEDTFQFPSDAKMLCVLLQSHAIGTVYFDDVSLELVETEKFQYSTSHMFHYTDEKEGKASVSVMPFYQGTGLAQTLSVSFGVYDGKTRLQGADNVPFINEEASFTYSVDVLKEKGKKYTLSIKVMDASKAVGTFTQSLYRYDKPNFLDADGNFRNETGEIINPFIAWDLREEHFDEAKKAGFTMHVFDYELAKAEKSDKRSAHLAAAKEADLYPLFPLFIDMKAAAHPDNIENTKKIVEMYKDDRSFVGWVVQDEPLGAGITEEAKALLELSYKTIRDIDPNHPVILLDYNKVVFKETSKYCDIFMPNAYGLGYSNVRNYVEEAVKYSNGHPVWPNIAAYAPGEGTVDALPTGDQVQHFIYQSFLGGASGVSVYEFNAPVRNPNKTPLFKTPLWAPLVDTGNTEIPVLFDLFVHGKEEPVCEETTSYVQRKWTREDGEYYFLLSKSDADSTIEYKPGEGKGIKLLGGDGVHYFTVKEGTLTISLHAGDVLMFKVFDKTREAQITQNGIGVKNMQTGNLTYMAPAGATRFAVALYRNENGREILEWIHWYTAENGTIDKKLIAPGEEYEMTAKVFSWDDNLKPIGKAAVALPVPDPTI